MMVIQMTCVYFLFYFISTRCLGAAMNHSNRTFKSWGQQSDHDQKWGLGVQT